MTDLSIFDFIVFDTTNNLTRLSRFDVADDKDHNFIYIEAFKDNSGCYAKCKLCQIEIAVYKVHGNLKFQHLFTKGLSNKKLTCSELVIKNILE